MMAVDLYYMVKFDRLRATFNEIIDMIFVHGRYGMA